MDALKIFVEQVRTMRDLQKQYFQDRAPAVLKMAKAFERIVDIECDKILNGQGGLL